MRIAVIDDYQGAFNTLDAARLLGEHNVVCFSECVSNTTQLAEKIFNFDALILTQQRTAFPRSLAESLPELRLISQTGRNTSHIDIEACTECGIVVAAAGAGQPNAAAELTWGLILSSLRHIPHEVQRLKEGLWQTTLGTGLKDKTLGIYAYGRIGSLVANVGRTFGMNVVCWGRDRSLIKAKEDGFNVAKTREEFFANADVVCLHLPLSDATRGIVTLEDLGRMKPTALIVNTSRASLIQAGALEMALRAGRPGHAAIDVFENEPVIDGNHPFLEMPNVICTPHLGYVEKETYESYFSAAAENILSFVAGKANNVINPEAFKWSSKVHVND